MDIGFPPPRSSSLARRGGEARRGDRPQQYDPTCYLCPGNPRAGGVHNPKYEGTFVFDNDFAALLPNVPHARLDLENRGLLVAEGESGLCRVICFSPRHDLTLSTMTAEEIEPVVRTWKEQFTELGAMPDINNVQIFENRGAMMGASNPHPHCQIWATHSIPEIPARELATQRNISRKMESAYCAGIRGWNWNS